MWGFPYLLTYPFPTIPALDRVLDDAVLAHITVHSRDDVQNHADNEEAEDLVEERAVGHDDSAIVERLLHGVVAFLAVERPSTQDGKLLVQIPIKKGKKRNDGENDVAGHGGHYGSKGGSETVVGCGMCQCSMRE